MKATIWHNPRCGTSRKTLAILEETPGVEVEIFDYLKTPPSREELNRIYARADMTPRDGLRAKEPLAKEMGLLSADDATIVEAMLAHPILIERPLVETEKGAVLCRPQNKVEQVL